MLEKSGAVFNIEDEVFYKWDNKLAWEGPGRVLGQDGPVVFIWHDLHYIRSYPYQVQLTNANLDNSNLSHASNAIPLAQTNTPPSLDIPKPQPFTDTAIDTTIMTLIMNMEPLQMKRLQMNVEMITSQMNIKRKIVLLNIKVEVLPMKKTLM